MLDIEGDPINENESSSTMYYGFSVRLDTTWQTPDEETPGGGAWAIVLQLHGPDALNASPAFAIHAAPAFHVHLRTGDLDIVTDSTPYAFSDGSLNLGDWIDFIIKIVYAKGATGSFQVWRRNEGELNFTSVLTVTGVSTLQYKTSVNGGAVGDHYWAHGLYEPEQTTITNILWLDGITRGYTYNSVLISTFPSFTGYEELPQNLLTNTGTLIEDFETIGDWTATTGSVADDAVNYVTGTHSVASTSASGTNCEFQKTVNYDMSAFGRGMLYYKLDPISYGDMPSVKFSSDSGFANYIRYKIKCTPIPMGKWDAMHFHQAGMITDGTSPDLSAIIRFRCRQVAQAGETPVVNFDGLYLGMAGVPTFCIEFSDGRADHYTAAKYMSAHNMRSDLSIVTNLVGDSGRITWAQLRELEAEGHCIVNQTFDHTSLATLTEAQQEAELTDARDDGIANGIWVGSHADDWRYMSYPNGSWNANTLTAFDNVGMRLGWNEIGNSTMYGMPFAQKYMLPETHLTIGMSIGTITGLIDEAIAGGMLLMVIIENMGAESITLDTFYQMVDYLVTKRSQIYTVTADDLYKAQTRSIIVPATTV
jgi:peptidoglycan/xylan/chitin deacetylase (PgdA/CDA1 family)